MIRIGIILGSTSPNRVRERVAKWVYDLASWRGDAEFELIDLREDLLPHLDEPLPAARGQYQHNHTRYTRAWADKIALCDGFVMVTPGYNHAISGVLKNALDYLYAEWNNKAAGNRLLRRRRRRSGSRAVAADPRGTADGRRGPTGRAVAAHRVRELHHLQAGRAEHHRFSTHCSTRSSPGAPRSRRCVDERGQGDAGNPGQAGVLRRRVGDYRIVYRVRDDRPLVPRARHRAPPRHLPRW